MNQNENDNTLEKFKSMLKDIVNGNPKFHEIDWQEDAWYKQEELKAEAKEVTDAVTRLIGATKGLRHEEQVDAFVNSGYPFMRVEGFDKADMVAIFNRIVFEADWALKSRLFGSEDGFLMGDDEINAILCNAPCIHFQCETYPVEHDMESFTEYEIYIAYLLPGTHRAIVVRVGK